MIIYNVTIKVDASIARPWLDWMLQEHIPDMIGTGCFQDYRLVRLLETDDTEGPTYAVQYFADQLQDYQRYTDQFAAELRRKGTDKWGDRFIAFRTLMEVVK